jgi:hypothetical protein
MGYYTGDYYQGDPFWGALAGLAKRGVGMLLGGVRGGGPKQLPAATTIGATIKGIHGAAGRVISATRGAIVKHPVLSAAGAAGAAGMLVGAGAEYMMGPGGCAPKGFHMSKPRGGHCPSTPHLVRNRRMNVANGRALSRAVRRLHHFARKYRKVVGFVSPRKPKGRMYFKKRASKK